MGLEQQLQSGCSWYYLCYASFAGGHLQFQAFASSAKLRSCSWKSWRLPRSAGGLLLQGVLNVQGARRSTQLHDSRKQSPNLYINVAAASGKLHSHLARCTATKTVNNKAPPCCPLLELRASCSAWNSCVVLSVTSAATSSSEVESVEFGELLEAEEVEGSVEVEEVAKELSVMFTASTSTWTSSTACGLSARINSCP